MLRSGFQLAALALALAAASCKSDKSTGPSTSSGFAGNYQGIIAGATKSGVLKITIPTATAAAPARGSFEVMYSTDASVALTGSLAIKGDSTWPISGSFDNTAGTLVGVTAGPYTITGSFTGGKFTGSWTGPGATAGGWTLLPVSSGATAISLCGAFTGTDDGVWNLSVVLGSTLVLGMAANPSGVLPLAGTITAGGPTYSITNITSSIDASVKASGSLVTPANTASGFWKSSTDSGTWSGSATACN